MNIESSEQENILSEKRKFQLEEGILIFLLILSLVGVGITDYSPDDGYWYWLIMIFVFGFSAIFMGWLQSKKNELDFKNLFIEQAIHWGCSMLIVGGAFTILHSDKLNPENTGLVILLILSLATVLDGLRVGWRFSLTGVFLGVSAIIAAHYESFMWMELLMAILIVAGTVAWEIRSHKKSINE